MKIAIIGGGIFGCFSAIKFKEEGFDVDIYDKGDILTKATMNNQHRLHLGFHYPRSMETIEECKSNFDIFTNYFTDCVEFGDDNIYLVHKDSVIDPDLIMRNFENMNLEYDLVDLDSLGDKLKDVEQYVYALNTKEGFINLNKVSDKLKENLDGVNIINREIKDDDFAELSDNYDYIINLTYENPNLFQDFFELKYEYCMLVNIAKNKTFDKSITIIDGPFVSLYDACNDEMTLSSVKYTPFIKSDSYEELQIKVAELTEDDIDNARNNIIEHCAEFLEFDSSDVDVNRDYLTYKIKLMCDENDKRPSLVKKIDNTISVLNGKLSTVGSTYLKIRNLL